MNKLVHKKTFEAVDESGRVHLLHTFAKMIETTTLAGGQSFIEGLKTTKTDSGQHCNRLEDGRYKIVATDQILTPLES